MRRDSRWGHRRNSQRHTCRGGASVLRVAMEASDSTEIDSQDAIAEAIALQSSLASETGSTDPSGPPDAQDVGYVCSVARSTECHGSPTEVLDAGAKGKAAAYSAETSPPGGHVHATRRSSGPPSQQPTPHLPRGASVPDIAMAAADSMGIDSQGAIAEVNALQSSVASETGGQALSMGTSQRLPAHWPSPMSVETLSAATTSSPKVTSGCASTLRASARRRTRWARGR